MAFQRTFCKAVLFKGNRSKSLNEVVTLPPLPSGPSDIKTHLKTRLLSQSSRMDFELCWPPVSHLSQADKTQAHMVLFRGNIALSAALPKARLKVTVPYPIPKGFNNKEQRLIIGVIGYKLHAKNCVESFSHLMLMTVLGVGSPGQPLLVRRSLAAF